jgi:hypothetical protein
MNTLDKRTHAYRDDLADVRLEGKVTAARFVSGQHFHCTAPIAGIHRAPAANAMQISQVLWGENLLVFEQKDDWSFVQLTHDQYVGYVRSSALQPGHVLPTHKVTNKLAHCFPQADLKSQPATVLPLHAQFESVGLEGDYLALVDGRFVFAAHTSTIASSDGAIDFVSVAETFLHTPYLWGGKTALGLDCSGLVQIALQAGGIACPRDSDMQEREVGAEATTKPRQRGDLIFWKGHVGIMQNEATLLHANGHHLKVVSEPFPEAVARIAAKGSHITSVRRI